MQIIGILTAGSFVRTPGVFHLDVRSQIEVRVSGVSALRGIIGNDTVVVLKTGSALGDLFTQLEEQFGSAYRELVGEGMECSLRKRFNLLYNGQFMPPEENLNKVLSEGDEIVFFQMAGA
jgi:molybdopterin converting factor small subunit